VPRRPLDGYQGILLTDGHEAYESVAQATQLTHAGCFAHVRRKFDEAHKEQARDAADSQAKIAGEFICELYLVEKALWDKDQPISREHRVRVRSELSAPIMAKFHAWLERLAPQVLPQSLLGKAVHYTLGE
jgi:transposase